MSNWNFHADGLSKDLKDVNSIPQANVEVAKEFDAMLAKCEVEYSDVGLDKAAKDTSDVTVAAVFGNSSGFILVQCKHCYKKTNELLNGLCSVCIDSFKNHSPQKPKMSWLNELTGAFTPAPEQIAIDEVKHKIEEIYINTRNILVEKYSEYRKVESRKWMMIQLYPEKDFKYLDDGIEQEKRNYKRAEHNYNAWKKAFQWSQKELKA